LLSVRSVAQQFAGADAGNRSVFPQRRQRRGTAQAFGYMNTEHQGLGYSTLDPIILSWVEKHGFTLFDRMEGGASSLRCVYLSSQKGECFQIWIDEPASGRVSLHAADVETLNDEELRQDWSVPVQELPSALDAAVAHVRHWMDR
jgi:hypothetical protein